MYSDSRKAQHNSFAHHRASMLFRDPGESERQPAIANTTAAGALSDDGVVSLRRRINAGILGQRRGSSNVGYGERQC